MVSGLDRLEQQLKTLIETHAASLLGLTGSDEALAERLVDALHAELKPQPDGRVHAPHVFALNVNPNFVQEIRANQALLDGLSAALLQAAADNDLHLDSPPAITVFPDASVAEGHFTINALRATQDSDTHDLAGNDATPSAEDAANTPSPIPPRAFLIVGGSTIFGLEQDVVNIGRKLSNELVVDDPRVSRNHCQLRAVKGQFVLFDLNSSGGTFVNGKRITQMTLQPGDVISLAGIPLVYGQDVIRGVDETHDYYPPSSASDDISTTSLDIQKAERSDS